MEDKFTNQEEQLRALTENFSLDIDTSELWDKIETQLPPVRQERRRPLIWWFASGILVVLISILVWSNRSDRDQKEILANFSNNTTHQTETKESIDSNTKHTHISPTLTNPPESVTTQQLFIDTETVDNFSLQPSTAKTEKINIPAIFRLNRYDEKLTSRKEGLFDQGTIEQSSIDALVNPSTKINIESEVEDQNQERAIVFCEILNFSDLNVMENDTEYDLPILEIKPLKSTFWLPYYALSSGINTHKSKIYSNSSEALDFAQFENEKPLLGLSSDIRFGLENENGWRFGISLNYARLVNRFTQIEADTIINNVSGNISSKIDDDGNITHVGGTLIQTSITNYNLNWHRKHDFINVQLNVGKRIFGGEKFSIYTDAIVSKNIWSRHSGYYFTEGINTINRFSSNESNPYQNAGYNVGLSMDLEYKLSKISIFLRPFAKVGLNNITQNSNYYQIKNSQYGAQLGIVYRP